MPAWTLGYAVNPAPATMPLPGSVCNPRLRGNESQDLLTRSLVLPLPEGEGRGEGESALEIADGGSFAIGSRLPDLGAWRRRELRALFLSQFNHARNVL